MNAIVALSAILSLLALLPTPCDQADVRVKRSAAPPWARPTPDNNFYGPPGHGKQGNKFGNGNGRSGKWVPPGLSSNGPPGLNKGSTPPRMGEDNSSEFGDDYERPDDGKPWNNNDGYEPTDGQNAQKCRDNEFRCGSSECIPESARCNNRVDCRDSSDEVNCSTTTENDGGCVLPPQPDGGIYELGGCGRDCTKRPGDKVPTNSILTYTCRTSYVLVGNTVSVCVDDQWHLPPSCLKMCPPLTSTSVDIVCSYQGDVISCNEQMKPGTQARLACKQSYKLPLTDDPAYRVVTCLEDGLWDRRVFRCLPECGTSIAQGNTLIVNGFEAKVGIFPWHVGIYNRNTETEYEQICGGSLISNNLVVSAAHCFYDEVYSKLRNETYFAVAAGKHYRDWEANETYAQKSLVAKIWLGSRYIGASGNFAQDIALIKLASPFELTTLVRPVCLDWDNIYEREQLQVGQTGKAVGWGKDIHGKSSETLQEINMPFVAYDQCLSGVPDDFRGYITSDKFCAGRLNGSSLCEGDSGGGLCFQMHGTWYLRGIVSVGPVKGFSCDYNSYVGFTYISFFRDWIRDIYLRS